MSKLESPDPLDTRIDLAARALRHEDSAAVDRLVSRLSAPGVALTASPGRVRPGALRLSMGALTLALAGAALLPWGKGGQAEANLGFAQVKEATRNAPHSIARSYDLKGKETGYTVWREGAKYATELWRPDRSSLLSETRNDGRRKLHSFQFEARAKAPGYRFASLGPPTLSVEAQFDTLEGILRRFLVNGPEPVAERVGERLRYRIRPAWARTQEMIVEADAKSGRVLEIRSPEGRMVLDYETPIPPQVFRPRPSAPDIAVIDFATLRPKMERDIGEGAGAWLAGDGTLWRVYRGSTATPPAIPGRRLFGRTVSHAFQKNGVVAVGSTVKGAVPPTVKIGGRRVPVRKVGMIFWWKGLFQKPSP